MRVLVTSCPAYGHVLPMLPLIRAALRAGADVRVATGPDLVGPLRDRGIDVRPVGPAFADSWAEHERIWAAPEGSYDEKMTAGILALFGTPAGRRAADLAALTHDWQPDLVVHEVLELGGPIVAGRLGVRSVVHGFGPMYPYFPDVVRPCAVAAGEPDLWSRLQDETYLDICPPALRPDGPAAWADAVALRPTVGERGPVPPEVAEVLRADRPLAYFTLGTVKNTASADFAAGLAALADYPGTVLATTGRPLEPAVLGPVPDNVVLADFVPQASVLPHADLVVSHCGAGTMLGALALGIPQVAAPRGTDQPQNAELLGRSGAGVVVPVDDYGVDTLTAAVAEVTGDPAYAENARRVQGEIEAMPDADEVWARLAAGVSA